MVQQTSKFYFMQHIELQQTTTNKTHCPLQLHVQTVCKSIIVKLDQVSTSPESNKGSTPTNDDCIHILQISMYRIIHSATLPDIVILNMSREATTITITTVINVCTSMLASKLLLCGKLDNAWLLGNIEIVDNIVCPKGQVVMVV